MSHWLLAGSDTQYADYWLMIPEVLRPGGGIRIGGLFEFSNDHLVAIPKIIYWLNVRAGHGSNRTLGMVVVVVVAAQVGVLIALLARSGIVVAGRVGIIVAASGLLYSPLGAWNFLKAMSGTAWLTANLFVLAAILARSRGRVWVACACGAAACASYGSALAVWPSLLVLGWLIDRRLRRQWPVAIAAAVVVGTYLVLRSDNAPQGRPLASPVVMGRFWLEVVGGSVVQFDSVHAAVVGGVVVSVVVIGVAGSLVTNRRVEAAPWIAIALFGLGGSLVVAIGRAQPHWPMGSNRHASLGALAIIGALGMWCTALSSTAVRRFVEDRVHEAVLPAVVGLLGIAIGLASTGFSRLELDRMSSRVASQDQLALLLRFGLAEGNTVPLGGLAAMPDGIEGLLEASDHTPFSDDPGFDCGLAGTPIDEARFLDRLPSTVDARSLGALRTGQTALMGAGWIRDPRGEVACVVVLGDRREVIGAGAVGAAEAGYGAVGMPPGSDGFVTVQPIGTDAARTYLVLTSGDLVVVPRPGDVGMR